MKKVLVLVLALALTLAFAAPVSADASVDLIADGGSVDTAFVAGTVDITDDGDTITVTYNITAEGYVLTETHVDVAILPADLEQNKNNNPRVGKFEWSAEAPDAVSPATVEVPEGALPDTVVCIAIHGVIWNEGVPNDPEVPETYLDDIYETIWADGTDFGGNNWSMYVEYTLNPEVLVP